MEKYIKCKYTSDKDIGLGRTETKIKTLNQDDVMHIPVLVQLV